MSYLIRPATAADALGVVGVINKHFREPIWAPWFERTEGDRLASPEFMRLVAADAAGAVLGSGSARTGAGLKRDHYHVQIFVDPASAGRGIGSGLYEQVEAAVRARGALVVHADVKEEDTSALRWAETRGFAEEHRMYESTIDLAAWNPERFAAQIAAVEAQGVRFVHLEAGDENLRRLHALLALTQDVPGQEETHPPFAQWQASLGEHWSPEGYLLAVAGDAWVGVTIIRWVGNGGLYNDFTGVDRAWRGKGVALALKAFSLNWAKATGAPYVRTNNHSVNEPMLAVNRKLGYKAEPGLIGVMKRLA